MEINKNEETVAKSSESIFCRGCLAFLLKAETLSFRCFAQARSQKINGKQRNCASFDNNNLRYPK